ncbi:MAG TPA: NAD-dependent epimerase/dehydratase family protein [Methanocella sp.]|nr:NAD-dependent epimerase/dehydratase family protein [Methanocella sp.]
MSARSKTILVTGGSGFIGGNLISRFRDSRYNVIAPGHRELDLLSQDDVDRFFREHIGDCVIHCANVGGNRKTPDARDVVGRNLRMYCNIARNSSRFERLIHFGSGAEYDKGRALRNIGEGAFGERIPLDEYGFSKYLISRQIEASEGAVCLRLFGVFGPGEDFEYKFISNAILKNLIGMPIRIMQNVYFDWLYVEDLMDVTRYFLENKPTHRAYNLTSGTTTDLLTIARTINDLSYRQSEIEVVNQGLNLEYSGSNARLRGEIPGFNFTPIRKAIPKMMKYYREKIGSIDLEMIRTDTYASRCAINREKSGGNSL